MGRKEKQVLRVGACEGEAKQLGDSWFECRFWRSDADVRYNIKLALRRGSGFIREISEICFEHDTRPFIMISVVISRLMPVKKTVH
jgi:hypothetical protein